MVNILHPGRARARGGGEGGDARRTSVLVCFAEMRSLFLSLSLASLSSKSEITIEDPSHEPGRNCDCSPSRKKHFPNTPASASSSRRRRGDPRDDSPRREGEERREIARVTRA